MQSICHHARRNGLSIVPGHARSLAANEPRVGAARCPKKAAQPLARFASMISGQLWRGHVLSAERVDAHLPAHAPKATSAGPTNARAALHLREDGTRPPRKMRSEKLAMWQIARNSQPLAGLVSLWRTFVEKD